MRSGNVTTFACKESKYCSICDLPSGIKQRDFSIRIKYTFKQSACFLNKSPHSDLLNDPLHEFLIVQDNELYCCGDCSQR